MTKYQILTSQNIEFETEEEAIEYTKSVGYQNLNGDVNIALVYENARSQKNLLGIKIDGKFASHLSSKKISVKDLK